MMVIDAHNHFWKYHPREYAWITDDLASIKGDFLPEDLKVEMEKNGVSGCIAVQARQSIKETEFLLDLSNKYPFIEAVVGWVDICDKSVAGTLEKFCTHPKFKGVRHIIQDEENDEFMLRPDFMSGVSLLKDFNLTYDILIHEKHLPVCIKFMEAFPNQKFILDHIAKPMINEGKTEPWSSHIRELAQNKNLLCKVSGLVTEADWQSWDADDIKPYLDVVFEAFGSERIIFGSDWPVCLLASDYAGVMNLVLDYIKQFSTDEQKKILGTNAQKFYNI